MDIMREIELTQGLKAQVDDDLYEELNRFKWCAHKLKLTFYATRTSPKINGKQRTIRMHHEVIGRPPKGLMSDHKDGNGLNNLKSNLRFVTNRQNSQNRKNIQKTSKYPGVSWSKSNKKWYTHIMINRETKSLGHFTNEKEAFEIYRKAVNELNERIIGEIPCNQKI